MSDEIKLEKWINKGNEDKFIWQPGTIVITKSPAKKLVTPKEKKQ